MREYLKLTKNYFGLHHVFVQSLAYLRTEIQIYFGLKSPRSPRRKKVQLDIGQSKSIPSLQVNTLTEGYREKKPYICYNQKSGPLCHWRCRLDDLWDSLPCPTVGIVRKFARSSTIAVHTRDYINKWNRWGKICIWCVHGKKNTFCLLSSYVLHLSNASLHCLSNLGRLVDTICYLMTANGCSMN
jgi:hypothetical protein